MNQLSILLVEDDPDDVELMQEAMKNGLIHCSIAVLNEGNTVIPYLEVCKNFPNVIVLDLNIPKLHGREVLKALKSNDHFKRIPVVVLTTASSQAEKENCLKLGANMFLTKPSTVQGFSDTVKAIVTVASRPAN